MVLLGAAWLYLHVSVGSRFEAHFRPIPSRVYSDVLALSKGVRLDPDALEARLERSGYARTISEPGHPGQFRRGDGELQVHLRRFETPAVQGDAGRLNIRFRGGVVRGITDENGRKVRHALLEPEVLTTLYGARQEERDPLPLDEVPERQLSAILAAEDSRFFLHHGLDLRGIARAALANAKSGGIVQGGSTITQQTVKNLFLDHRRTWTRKLREAAMSLILDGRYSKSRILEVYLNEVYLGQRGPVAICGLRAASRHYFGRDPSELTLGEQALLAGLIRSPGRYDPFRHPDRARERRAQVLEAMTRLDWVDEAEAASAASEPLTLSTERPRTRAAAWVAEFVVADISETVSRRTLREQGLRIYTTVDSLLQERASEALTRGLARLEAGRPSLASRSDRRLQGAVVMTRPTSGEVLALVGGRDWGETQFNRAVHARRQPGSCFKPFVFAAAFERAVDRPASGLTPASVLADEPLSMRSGGETWSPQNYDRKFRGPVTAREALEKSLNVPTIRAANRVGIENVAELAVRCGITSRLPALPSLALGAVEVTPLELAAAYGTLAQGGTRARPWVVRAVTGRDGERIAERRMERRRVLDERTTFMVNDILRGVFERGTARSARALGYHGRAAGKTGTTDDTRDAWFVGYTPELLGLVWVGFDDNSRTGLTGASGALPIWVDAFASAESGRPWARAGVPDGLVSERVDPVTGLLATRDCPRSVEEWFVAGTVPVEACGEHGGKPIALGAARD